MWREISSTRPSLMNCRPLSPPPPIATVFRPLVEPFAAAAEWPLGGLRGPGDEPVEGDADVEDDFAHRPISGAPPKATWLPSGSR
jgi:hypothetical protein